MFPRVQLISLAPIQILLLGKVGVVFVEASLTDCDFVIHLCNFGSPRELHGSPFWRFVILFVNVILIVTRVLFWRNNFNVLFGQHFFYGTSR